MDLARSSAPAGTWPEAGRRLIATALGWIVAVIASLPVAAAAAGIAVLSGATSAQITGSGPVGVAVVVLGLHLSAGVLAAITIPAAWRRVLRQTTTFRRAIRVTLPIMSAVAALEAVKAGLPALGYLAVTVLQLTLALAPFTMRGLPGAVPATPSA
jgi:hypothetical protein